MDHATDSRTHGNQNQVSEISELIGKAQPEPVKAKKPAVEKPDPPARENGADPKDAAGVDVKPAEGPILESGDTEPAAEDLDDPGTGADDAGGPSGNEPVTLKELAESMELETRELYDVEISVGKDETITLGALKDSFKEFKTLKAGQAKFEERKTSSENEIMVAKRQIEQLVQIGAQTGSINPQVLQQLEVIHGENVARERKAVLQAIPEWSDSVTREADFARIYPYAAQFGFSKLEVDNQLDHRVHMMLNQSAKREESIRKARTPTPVPASLGTSKKVPKVSKLRQQLNAAKSGNATREQKLGAISTLINQ